MSRKTARAAAMQMIFEKISGGQGGEASISGVVEAVTRGINPQVKVNGMLYSMDEINAVYGN